MRIFFLYTVHWRWHSYSKCKWPVSAIWLWNARCAYQQQQQNNVIFRWFMIVAVAKEVALEVRCTRSGQDQEDVKKARWLAFALSADIAGTAVCVCVCAGVESATVIYTDTVFITKTALQLLMKMAPWATKLIQVFSLLELLECSDACLGPRIGVTLFQFCFNWFHSCQVNHQFTIVLYCGVSGVKTLDVWLEGREFRSQHH